MADTLRSKLRKAGNPVQRTQEDQAKLKAATKTHETVRHKELPPPPHVLEVEENVGRERQAKDYVTVVLTGSNNTRYKVAVPKSYAEHIPKFWKWDQNKLKVAEAIAMGMPIQHIVDDPEYAVKTRMTIYAWLEHPEFREHVDGLTLETGFANRRERIAGLNRVTQKLFDKLVNELDSMKLTDKAIGSIIMGIRDIAKMVATEKGEYVESSKVEQQSTLSATVAVGAGSIEDLLNALNGDERKRLEQEFDAAGDSIIQQYTGTK